MRVSEIQSMRHEMEFDMPRIEEDVEEDEEEEEEEEEEEDEFPYEEGDADGDSEEEDEEAMFYEQQERKMEASGAKRMDEDVEGRQRSTKEGARDQPRASGSKPAKEERCVDAKVVRNDLSVQEIHPNTRS